MNKFMRYCKPLASKTGQKLVPICYVDCSLKVAGPRLTAIEYQTVKEEVTQDVDLSHQMPLAVSQWCNARTKMDQTWLKSWYFPLDAFQPWPKRTNLRCWWCTHTFEWNPFPLPYYYDRCSNRYKSVGIFCGPSCAKAYAVNVKKYSNMDAVFLFIETIAEDFYGYCIGREDGVSKRSTIPVAPDKELLQDYCGPEGMTIEQFRSLCACGRSMKLLPPAWITIKQVVQGEQQVAKMKRVYHVENPDNIQRTQDLVRVHRIPFAGLGAKRFEDYVKQLS